MTPADKTPDTRWPDLARAVVLYAATRAALALFVWLTGQHFECHGPRCDDRAFFPENLLLNGLFQWDAYQYSQLAERGYYLGEGFDTTAPYFPGFPLAAWAVGKLLGSPLAGGIVVNHLATIGGAYFIARLARRLRIGESDARPGAPIVANEATLFWLASPLTLFFSVYLTEALFAFASVFMLWSVARGSFGVALLAGLLVTSTRNAGVIVVASAALLAWERRDEVKVGALGWACLALSPLGFVGFLLVQHHQLGDVFAWVDVQSRWGRGLSTPWATLRHDWLGLPGLSPEARDVDAMYRVQEVLALLITAPLFFFRRRLGIPWAILFLGLSEWLLPLTSGSLISAARYQAGNVYFALAIPALLAPRPALRGLAWMLFGMVLAWYASTYPFGVWAS